jgi:hypothetical protein
MCFNAEVSLSSFIVGSTACIFLAGQKKTPLARVLAIAIWWAILMQAFEYVIWTHPECDFVSLAATKAAFVTNMLQPVVLFLLGMALLDLSTVRKTGGGMVTMAYLCYILWATGSMGALDCMQPLTCGAKGIDLYWWNRMGKANVVYPLTLLLLVLLVIQDFKIALCFIAFTIGALFIASVQKSRCAHSFWCFLVCGLPLFLLYVLPSRTNSTWQKDNEDRLVEDSLAKKPPPQYA